LVRSVVTLPTTKARIIGASILSILGNYTTWLNIAFLIIALLRVGRRRAITRTVGIDSDNGGLVSQKRPR